MCNKLCDVVKLSCIYVYLWCEGLHFSEKAVSLHRVFHSIRFKVNKVGIQWYPIFFVPTSRCPRCVRLERHMCHSVKLFAPKDFLPCRCWWGAWLVSFFSFLLFFLLIFPTRDASPPLEVAFPFLLFFSSHFFLLIFPTRDASPPLERNDRRKRRVRKCGGVVRITPARPAPGGGWRRPVWWQRCSKGRRRGA